MKFEDISRLAPAFACIVALAATGCGAAGDGVDSQAGASNLQQGPGQFQGARGDGGFVNDDDDDVDEAADEAAGPGRGAAGGAPVDKPGRRNDADADGGVDEGDGRDREGCERHGFGGGFGPGGGFNSGGGFGPGGFGPGSQGGKSGKGGKGDGSGNAASGKGGSQAPQDAGASDDDDDDDDSSQGSRGRR